VAAPRETVGRIWELCREVGGDCQRIDSAACALARAGALLRPPNSEEVWGLLDVGARAVRLILCVDNVPVLARSLNGGGEGWTQVIADKLKVSTESAELHKCDHGIRLPGRGRGPAAAQGAPEPAEGEDQ
jgi:cell division ATPase FtsA